MKTSNAEKEFLSTRNMAELLDLSFDGLKQLKPRHFVEGLHFIKLSPGKTGRVMWNRVVMVNWVQTRHDPSLHDKFCSEYLASLDKHTPQQKKAS